jgi:hypothetical protein
MHDIAMFLITEHSLDVNTRGFDREETLLHVSSRLGHVEIARVLLNTARIQKRGITVIAAHWSGSFMRDIMMWNLFRSFFWSMAQMRMRRTTKDVHRCIGHRIGESQWLLRYFSVMAQMRQPSVRINRLLYTERGKKRLLDFSSSTVQMQTPWTS